MHLNDSTQTTQINAIRQPVVFDRDGEVFASSVAVAEFFEKRHDDVLRAIDNLIAQEPSLSLRNFAVSSYSNDLANGRRYRSFDMTRDGLSLLAMGFTGAKALKWKIRYIEAFNIMEAELRAKPMIDPMKAMSDPVALRSMLLSYTEQVITLQAEKAELTPKAIAHDRLAGTEGLFGLIEAAKLLGQPPKAFREWLRAAGWIYKRDPGSPWLGYQDKVKAGYLDHKTYPYLDRDGNERTKPQVMFTPKGLTVLAKRLGVGAPDLSSISLH